MSQAFRLGLFVVAGLTVLFAGVFLIGSRESLFQRTYRVQAQFNNVAGLADGADVRVGGLHQGSVKHIELPKRPDAKITVVMALDKGTRYVVKKDSIAAIKSEGLIGDSYIEISFGSDGAAGLSDGDTIESEPPLDMSNLVKKADQLLDTAKDAMTDLNSAASNVEQISTKINEGQGSLGGLINDKTIYQQAAAGATALNENMEALKHNFLLRGFFNKRGYEDASEITKNAIARLPSGEPQKVFEYDGEKLFNSEAKIKDQKALKEAGEYLQSNSFGLAVVAAATGMKGDTDKDRVLSEGRAAAVREYLAKNFRLNDTRIKTLGLGKSDQAGDNGKAEILVYASPSPASAAK